MCQEKNYHTLTTTIYSIYVFSLLIKNSNAYFVE